MGKPRKTTEQFIEDARKVHGDIYDYSLATYTNSKTKVSIICEVHGIFEQNPSNHLHGMGCPKCAREKQSQKRILGKEEFIRRAREIHGNRYGYELVEYKTTSTKVRIVCDKHGVFEQEPSSHIAMKCGCPECARENKKKKEPWDTERFIKEARKIHGDRYDYSEAEYVNQRSKMKIICKLHGTFEQSAVDHLKSKHGCPKCAGNYQRTTEDFIEEAKAVHGDKYDYSSTVFHGALSKTTIICPIHGPFEQLASTHLRGCGCSECGRDACREQFRKDFSLFVEQSRQVHGDKYEYPEQNTSTPIPSS